MWPNKFSTKSEGRERREKKIYIHPKYRVTHSEPYFQSVVGLNTMTERSREWRAGACGAGWSNGRTNEGKNKASRKTAMLRVLSDKRSRYSNRKKNSLV